MRVIVELDELDVYVRKALAKKCTIPKTLKNLAKDENSNVRIIVAENPNTPAEVLSLLAKDRKCKVRQRVAENPNTPAEVLSLLVEDDYSDVKESAAKNANIHTC